MQRLRIRSTRGEELKFISHLDLIRMWHRALRRARIPLAYSEGFNPHPRLSLAAPLAVGVTSEAELMDIMLTREVSPHWFTGALNGTLPAGARVIQALAVPLTQPALQAQVSLAEYRVEVTTDLTTEEVQSALDRLLALETLPWRHQRDTGPHSYDLRALVQDLWIEESGTGVSVMGMLLRSDSSGSGRPEQVAAALGFERPRSIHRTRLLLRKA